jgi:hypothetical protein
MNTDPARPDREQLATLLPAPAERDLPAGRHAVLKEYLMHEIGVRPAVRPQGFRRGRLALGGAFAAAAVAVVVAGSALLGGGQPQRPAVLAFGDGVVSPRLQQAIDYCTERARLVEPGTKPRLVNRGEAGQFAIAVFLTDDRMIACDAGPNGGGGNYGPYGQLHWLPGPISVEAASSTSGGGGDVFLAGRISKRVGRVKLDHGDGRATIARLSDGTFAVATDGAAIADGKAILVTFDKAGNVIDRRPALFLENSGLSADGQYAASCWTDPAGTAVYGQRGARDCKQADPWP